MDRRLRWTTFLLACVLVPNAGCLFVGKRILKETLGASASLRPIEDAPAADLRQVKGVAFGPVTTDLGPLCSDEFIQTLPEAYNRFLIAEPEAPFKAARTPLLTLDTEVMFFKKGGVDILGPSKFASVLVRMKLDGRPIGVVEVLAKSEASRTGPAELAEGIARKLADYFRAKKAPEPS